MKFNYLLWLVIAVLVILTVWYWINQSTTPTPTVTSPTQSELTTEETPTIMTPVEVALEEQSDLGQSGTAVLSEDANGMLVVMLTLTGGTFTAPQPAHIHAGACPKPGAVVYPLSNVVDGESVTTLDVSWDELIAAGDPLAINVHQSAAESSTYTACGDLPIGGEATMEKTPTEAVNY
ncbi:MAG: hypothetical protein UY13_C0002G0230 [Candidatus Pacebacteria bacterium GW2011_GWB1_47_8]|nr:MAG: hypothetical protein UX28_C0001G0378 [Candidatus Pacebacteria bacterium GW2011_GWA1_46_10]KKU84318.1 MAG: hypothetical protein UY13_C0002G0230 [Candidatus Pacebacteria bacterium GW2011_GWB1_47_8]HCR81256.1 hypothetical protein [Candidatus Paceibacterota bacterium]